MSDERLHTATCFVRLRADFTLSGDVRSIKAMQLYQRVPPCAADEIVVQLNIRVPDRAFDPPLALVDVDLGDVLQIAVKSEAAHQQNEGISA